MKVLFTEHTVFPVQNAHLAHALYFSAERHYDGVRCALHKPAPPRPVLATVHALFSSFVFNSLGAKYAASIPKKT